MPESQPPMALRAELAGRIMGFIISQAVYVAARLRIADLLAEGPRPAEELADLVDAKADPLYRLLRMLAGYGIFVERPDRHFANSELSELLREGADTFRDFALVFGDELFPAFGRTLDLVKTGDPVFDAVFGTDYDGYLAANRAAGTRFNRFMAAGKEALAEFLAIQPWRGDETVVDIGGGNGALVVALLERSPNLRGVVVDLPHVAAEAEERIRSAGLTERCEVVGGSYFDSVPEGDVYVLSRILHGLADDLARTVLTKVRSAIREGGRVLVIDGIVAAPNEPGMKLLDLVMLALGGGRERTEAEWRRLLGAGGFRIDQIHSPGRETILEARPT